jgi:hypothetical protein
LFIWNFAELKKRARHAVPLHVILASLVTDEEFTEFLEPWLGAQVIANPV